MKRVKSTCIETRAGNRQFVCNNQFKTITEQNHDQNTNQDRHIVRFDCGSDASTSCGSADTEGCKKDANFVSDFAELFS